MKLSQWCLIVFLINHSQSAHSNEVRCDKICDQFEATEHCLRGCEQFERGLERGCDVTCNLTSSSLLGDKSAQDELCIRGCQLASEDFVDALSPAWNVPRPFVNADSIEATSLDLRWTPIVTRTQSYPFLRHVFVLQQRVLSHFLDNDLGPWVDVQVLDMASGTGRVDKLEPFTSYQFRIQWRPGAHFASHQRPKLTSTPSDVVRTKAAGISSEPQLQAVKIVQNLHVNVSWCSPLMPRGPITFYRLKIAQISPGQSGLGLELHKDITADDKICSSYITGPLDFNTSYNISVSAFNGSGKQGEFTCNSLNLTRKSTIKYLNVDPINGWMFWVETVQHAVTLLGLQYRCSNNPQTLLTSESLGDILVFPQKSKLWIPELSKNELLQVSYMQDEMKSSVIHDDYRGREKSFNSIKQLFFFNKTLYWSSKNGLNLETHDPDHGFYHTVLNEQDEMKHLVLVHSSRQPVPFPQNPPDELEVSYDFVNTRQNQLKQVAVIKWNREHQEGVCDNTWKNWKFRVRVQVETEDTVIDAGFENFIVTEVDYSTLYTFDVQAFSSRGESSWSPVVKRKSLPQTTERPFFLWSSASQLYLNNIQEHVHSDEIVKSDLFMTSLFRTNSSGVYISEHKIQHPDYALSTEVHEVIAATKQIFFSNSSGIFRVKEGRAFIVVSNSNVRSIVFEPFAKMIYFSAPEEQLIFRTSLTEGNPIETLPIFTSAESLAIDSLLAQLCWILSSSKTSIHCSNLHGTDQRLIHQRDIWSGDIIISMTIDAYQNQIFFLTKNFIKGKYNELFSMPIFESEKADKSPRKLQVFEESEFRGPLRTYFNKLIWSGSHQSIVLYDPAGHSISRKRMFEPLVSFDIDYQGKAIYPKDVNPANLSICPESVRQNSLAILKKNESFILNWKPVTNISFGRVSYEIEIRNVKSGKSNILLKTSLTSVNLTNALGNKLVPNNRINILVVVKTPWCKSKQTKVKLKIPESPPSSPQNLRWFLEKDPNDSKHVLKLIVRWNKPLETNGVLIGYHLQMSQCHSFVINCTENVTFIGAEDSLEAQWSIKGDSLMSDDEAELKVDAFNKAGVNEKGEKLKVNLFQKSKPNFNPIPKFLSINQRDFLTVLDCDLKNIEESYQLPKTSKIEYMSLDTKRNLVFYVQDYNKLAIQSLSPGSKSDIIYSTPSADEIINGIVIDSIAQFVYFSVYQLQSSETQVYKLYFDAQVHKIPFLAHHATFDEFARVTAIDSFRSKLFFTLKNGQLEVIDLKFLKNGRLSCFGCQFSSEPLSKFYFTPTTANLITVMDKKRDSFNIIASNDSCQCVPQFSVNNPEYVDAKSELIGFDWKGHTIQWLKPKDKEVNQTVLLLQNATVIKTFDIDNEFTDLKPYCHLCQHPWEINEQCLTPTIGEYYNRLKIIDITDSSVYMELPQITKHARCSMNNMLPPTMVTIHLKEIGKQSTQEHTSVYIKDHQTHLRIGDLLPNTKYAVKSLELMNTYGYEMTKEYDHRDSLTFVTLEGQPSEPREVSAVCSSPSEIFVRWKPSLVFNADRVIYEVHYQTDDYIIGQKALIEQSARNERTPVNKDFYHNVTLTKLKPETRYNIWVVAKTKSSKVSKSVTVNVTTFSQINLPQIAQLSPRSMDLEWMAPKESQLVGHLFYCYPKGFPEKNRSSIENSTLKVTQPSQLYSHHLEDLSPGTEYVIKMKALYETELGNESLISTYFWPSAKHEMLVKTPAAKPLTPGQPYSVVDSESGLNYVAWNQPEENIMAFDLQAKAVVSPNDTDDLDHDELGIQPVWFSVYRDKMNRWPVSGLNDSTYIFRVRSKNAFGWSNFSSESNPMSLSDNKWPGSRALTVHSGPIIGIAVVIVILLFLVAALYCMTFYRRNHWEKKQASVAPATVTQDLELMTVRNNQILSIPNPLYDMELTAQDLELLPKIKRSQIELTRFIGSGAFGEVYEGRAFNVDPNVSKPLKVAIKTLRKGATEKDKTEFLKEARAMSILKHENILNLVGVCLDNDPHFIITDLMEGGDLSTFLKNSRSITSKHPLTKADLVLLSLDVAKGCAYLEENHFVHRDIAARNCLVSSTDPKLRKVKIGDFGLSRDIYKNNYYRKNGNGFLPVRWMAPESLIDGVYTSQSDVWSFGVLMWEIVTLGQQPYQAMSNLEVLNHVKHGGMLEVPQQAPQELKSLMLQCWNYTPDQRPNFAQCIQKLESISLAQETMKGILSFTRYPSPNQVMSASSPVKNNNQFDSKDSLKRDLLKSGSSYNNGSAVTMPVSDGSNPPRRSSQFYLQLLQEQNRLQQQLQQQDVSNFPVSPSGSENTFNYDLPPQHNKRTSVMSNSVRSPSAMSSYDSPRSLDQLDNPGNPPGSRVIEYQNIKVLLDNPPPVTSSSEQSDKVV